MARRRDHHSLAFLVAVIVTASGATRGLCFMPGTGEAGPRDAHACCKKGWTAAAPGCCMAGAADEEPARTAGLATFGAPVSVRIATVPAPTGLLLGETVAPGDRSHSPPGPVPLRI